MGCIHSTDGCSALQGNKLVTSYDKVTQRRQAERGGQNQRLLPISMIHYRRQICMVRKSISGCQMLGMGRVDGHQRSLRGCFWSDGNTTLISAVVTRPCQSESVSCLLVSQLFVTPWTLRVHQVPLSMGFTRQECWSG